MKPHRFLENFDRIAEAPGSLARLRQFILALAVRGKLVPQKITDRSALEIRAAKKMPLSDKGQFELPVNWVWATVGSIADARLGKMLDKARNKGTPKPYLGNINVRWFDFDLEGLLEMPFKDSELQEFTLRKGDVLICEGGEPGRAAVWDEREKDIYFQKAIHRVRFCEGVDSNYFVKALKASADDGRLAAYFTGVGIKHFTGKGLDSYLFPLPPIEEQERIVAKVDELMALCDQLEKAKAEREARRDGLTAAVLTRLDTCTGATLQKDVRFALDNLALLTRRPAQVASLRKTILNLAVRGKLVSQDSNEEPATELLSRLTDAKRQLILSKRLKRASDLGAVDRAEIEFELPTGWGATRLGTIYDVRDGTHDTPKYVEAGYPLITSKNLSTGRLSFDDVKFISEKDHRQISERSNVERDDILFAMIGSIGSPVIVDTDRAFSIKNVALFKYYDRKLSSPAYLCLFLRHAVTQMRESAGGGLQPFVSLGFLRRFPVPIPPLAEQHRIAVKVDELMTLCDRLEASLITGEQRRRLLLDALMRETIDSDRETQPALEETNGTRYLESVNVR